jgi:tRNA threonylcarbamoyladenosine biosynthesis protein TsaB
MNIIALDTSTAACSAALMLGDELRQRFEIAPRVHSSLILPMIDSLLDEAGIDLAKIDAIAFGQGPGSFVGVRIAAGVTQGIAYAADLPVVAVSSLAACAQGITAENVLVAFDARMNQIYWGAYSLDDGGIVRLQGEEQVISPNVVKSPANGDRWIGAGNGWKVYSEVLQQNMKLVTQWHSDAYPNAKDVARIGAYYFSIGRVVKAQDAIPVYLRDNVARKPKNSQSTSK